MHYTQWDFTFARFLERDENNGCRFDRVEENGEILFRYRCYANGELKPTIKLRVSKQPRYVCLYMDQIYTEMFLQKLLSLSVIIFPIPVDTSIKVVCQDDGVKTFVFREAYKAFFEFKILRFFKTLIFLATFHGGHFGCDIQIKRKTISFQIFHW